MEPRKAERNRKVARLENDFYPTQEAVTKPLFDLGLFEASDIILEPTKKERIA